MTLKWECQEPGWYATIEAPFVAVCMEYDGLWHCYVNTNDPPGDFAKNTLKEAKDWCERKVARQKKKP